MDISAQGWLFLSGRSFRKTTARWTFTGNSPGHQRAAGLRGSDAQERRALPCSAQGFSDYRLQSGPRPALHMDLQPAKLLAAGGDWQDGCGNHWGKEGSKFD